MRALIIDDEKSIRDILGMMLEDFDFDIEKAGSVQEGLSKLQEGNFDLILLDLRLPDGSGMEILRKLREKRMKTEVIIITAFASSETAKEAIRLGAFDYVSKPFDVSELRLIFRNVKKKIELEKKVEEYEDTYKDFIGESPKIKKIKEFVKKIAPYDANVLITGESGTGKEVVARTIHNLSNRKAAPFIAINCASLPSELLESELFGYKKGAFTGATRNKKGLIEEADGGTLFLDEIGDMPLALQAKLLRFLEEKTIRPIGGIEEISVNVRVIAATNRNLEEKINEGLFREDLFYRLSTITINLPPLRERKEDIPLLIEYFAKKLSKKYGKKFRTISKEFINYVMSLPLKGNVRELRNIVEKAVILSDRDILSLPLSNEETKPHREIVIPDEGVNLREILENLEKEYLLKALKKTGGKKKEAASLLGLTFREFRYRLSKYGIS
ncbi:sigma-54 dependent transcriptional regulator [Desulfurobacterium sp.]|uniref:sigma-54-dependent transcriptional regulator n=1 Tax=Desulfurobacterium sp. TaxID=2004706 RepID=UPI00262F14C8|nr:sigma-54 dependent transcriptional regulator [Desulfurobacterium sp.]